MSVVDLARRRAELERMSDTAGRRALVDKASTCRQPVDMRHARRFAEAVERNRPRPVEDPFWADRPRPDPA